MEKRKAADLALDEVADDLVVEVLDRLPLDALAHVLVLLRLKKKREKERVRKREKKERVRKRKKEKTHTGELREEKQREYVCGGGEGEV